MVRGAQWLKFWQGGNRLSVLLGIGLIANQMLIGLASSQAATQPTAPTPNTATSANAVTATPASDAPSLPTVERVRELLAQLTDDTELSDEAKATLRAVYEPLEQSLTKLKEVRERQQQLQQRLTSIPSELAATRRDLESAPPPPPSVSSHTPLDRARAIKGQREADLVAAKTRLTELLAKVEHRKTRRAQITEMLSSLQTQLQKFEAETPTVDGEGPANAQLLEAKQWQHQARLELLRQQIQVQQQEQRTIEAEEELVPLQVQLAQRLVDRLEQEVAMLTRAVSNGRESKIEAKLQSHLDFLRSHGQPAENSFIASKGSIWRELVRNHGAVEREQAEVVGRLDRLTTELADTQAAIQHDLEFNGKLRSGLGLKLLRQRERLPSESELRAAIHSVDARVEKVGTFQAQLELTADELAGGVAGQQFYLPPNSPVLERELALLDELNRDVDNYTSELVELKSHFEDLRDQAVGFRQLIDANVLWIRNMRPYALSDVQLAWQSFRGMVTMPNLGSLVGGTWHQIQARPEIFLLGAILCGGLFGVGTRLRRRIRGLGERAAKRNQIDLRPTLRTMWMTALLALPIAILFAIPGWRLAAYAGDATYVRALGDTLLIMAAAVLPLELARQILRPHGLAIEHFGLRPESAETVRNSLRWTIDLGMPVILLWGVAHYSGVGSIDASLARPLFVVGMAIAAYSVWQCLHPRRGIMSQWLERSAGGWMDRLRYLWHGAATATPLALGLLCLAGYSYSALQLNVQLYWTFWLVLSLAVLGGTLRRWVTLNRRKFLLAQARQRAAEAERREGVPMDVTMETNTLDLSEINAQTLRLINTLLTVLTILGLYSMWASVLPAILFLDNVNLWASELNEQGDVVQWVTLGGLLKSLPIILLTFAAVRNVPGLMEYALLQKLPLESAARYAITTLSSYAMLMAGVGLTARTLGLHWESIQWLVAALGVGLGFGLQEIFANFISGIILLFEQPIRVGDVVTLDGTTGAVSKIRMRATTVVNWDRQELIIPNKDLITGRVINWTLSDSTNRIVLQVGVAYGSDTRVACSLLDTICREHTNVADDPAPIVSFEGFGDSTLNLVVRCYLKSLDVRLQTIHDLHTDINDRFREAGLEIAFPQRDLHIRSWPATAVPVAPGNPLATPATTSADVAGPAANNESRAA